MNKGECLFMQIANWYHLSDEIQPRLKQCDSCASFSFVENMHEVRFLTNIFLDKGKWSKIDSLQKSITELQNHC